MSSSLLFFFFEGYGHLRNLHYPLRRQRQMCIRDSISPLLTPLPASWGHLTTDSLVSAFDSQSWGGVCRVEEFAQLLTQLLRTEPHESTQLADRLFPCFDRDGSGALSFREVFAGMAMLCAQAPERRLSAAFELIDSSGDGRISTAELRLFLRILSPFSMSVEEIAVLVATVMQHADSDHDGYIDYAEFMAWEGNRAILLWLDESAKRAIGELYGPELSSVCLLYTSDAADEEDSVDF
eukprot:TRINITY_DN27943_c0_g1_i1.p1 TRINITY_DN27943_c0_g1~~TRINITY_DN27943_c0_g1_i1.p1  ORF type:complete len:238 (-),score=56.47 TRINITY_DN27943_c0_g1_i1:48-761(-)